MHDRVFNLIYDGITLVPLLAIATGCNPAKMIDLISAGLDTDSNCVSKVPKIGTILGKMLQQCAVTLSVQIPCSSLREFFVSD